MEDIPADTVVTELKTDQNKLSLWKIDSEADLDDAFIALGSKCNNIGTICAVKLSTDDLNELYFDAEKGNTPTIGINEKHCNVINLNFVSLGSFVLAIIQGIRSNHVIKKSRPEMKKLFAKAFLDNKLDFPNLAPDLQKEIEKEIKKGKLLL